MTDEEFWASTPRELFARRKVLMDSIERESYAFASIQATLINAHFDTEGVPYVADDLLGKGDREQRKVQAHKDKVDLMRVQRSMLLMRPGVEPEGLPDWAKIPTKSVN